MDKIGVLIIPFLNLPNNNVRIRSEKIKNDELKMRNEESNLNIPI